MGVEVGTKVGLAKDQPFYSIFSHPSHSECDIIQYIMIVIFTLSELLPPNRIVTIVLTISVIVCAECDDKRLKPPRGDCWLTVSVPPNWVAFQLY